MSEHVGEFLNEVLAAYTMQEVEDATSWVIETTDPDLDEGDLGRVRLCGPYASWDEALAAAVAFDGGANELLGTYGYHKLRLRVLPVFPPLS